MLENQRMTRRRALGLGALAVAGALLPSTRALGSCLPTPGVGVQDPEADNWSGPFWREGTPFRHNLRGNRENGRILAVSGRVLDADGCRPLKGAVLDVWHCSPQGDYFTNDEFEAAGLFRGRIRCNEDGSYEYETMVPANYIVGGGNRPAHIHVVARVPGREDFVTQMYFENDPYLDSDPLDLVREPLICRLRSHEAGERFGDRVARGPFHSTEFDLVLPGKA